MKTVNVHEAKTKLSSLLIDVEAGEDVIIARNGTPIARLTKLQPFRREPGLLADEAKRVGFVYDPAVFAPMTDEEMEAEGWPV